VIGDELRKQTILALFADPDLLEQIALKGGNALRLVYGQHRTSIDIDFSLAPGVNGEFGQKVELAIRKHFEALGLKVVVFNLKPKPPKGERKFGYKLKFSVLEEALFLKHREEQGKIQALASDHARCVEVEFSMDEFLGSVETVDWDVPICVYTRKAIVIEKLRALCQQLPEYLPRQNKTARARDFYDICEALDSGLDLSAPDSREIALPIFGVKQVPLSSLLELGRPEEREHHRVDWRSVQDTVPSRNLKSFDEYFERVATLARNLHADWNV